MGVAAEELDLGGHHDRLAVRFLRVGGLQQVDDDADETLHLHWVPRVHVRLHHGVPALHRGDLLHCGEGERPERQEGR